MPKSTRSTTAFVKLPESMATKSIDCAKIQVSLSVTVPASMTGKKLDDWYAEEIETVCKDFKRFAKSRIKKLTNEE